MILVDTSIWIDHLRSGVTELISLLDEAQVLCHPFIVGELACGNLQNRAEILSLLKGLPEVACATHEEVMTFIDHRRLMARGIGYVDAHLVTATALTPPVSLWTRDRRLGRIATELGLSRR